MLYEMFHCVVWLRFTIVFEESARFIFQEEPFYFLTVEGHSLLLNVDIFMSDYITLHSKGYVYGHYHENLIFTRTNFSANNLDLLCMGVLIVQFIIIIII
jgi:hypothetical protein